MFHTKEGNLTKELELIEKVMPNYYILTEGNSKGIESIMKAEALFEQGNLEDASEYLNRALLLLNAVPDCEGEQAATYTNLANLYWEQGLLDEAKVTLIKAVDIYKEQPYLRSEGRYAAAIATLSNIYYSEEVYDKAATLCEEAMKAIEAEFGQNDAYKVIEANLEECRVRMAEKENSAN